MKTVLGIIVLVAVFIAVPFIVKREPTFTGTQYKSDDLTCNLFAHPPTFRDKEGKLITGHTIRLHPNGEVYSKAQMKDGVMHGPFISFWDNGEVQMSLVWDEGIRYKKMRSWDRNGKRLRGSGDEQMQQIRELDSDLNTQFETLESGGIIF
jgi:hypothetical protein